MQKGFGWKAIDTSWWCHDMEMFIVSTIPLLPLVSPHKWPVMMFLYLCKFLTRGDTILNSQLDSGAVVMSILEMFTVF